MNNRNENENLNPQGVDEFKNPEDRIQRIPPLNVDPSIRGNKNNVPIIPKIGADQPLALKTMLDYCRPNLDGTNTSIAHLRVTTNKFEIKPNVIQMVEQHVQFDGFHDEDSNVHL